MSVTKQLGSTCKDRSFSRYLAGYCMFLTELDLSPNTRIAYRYQVLHYLSWLNDSRMGEYGLCEPEARYAAVEEYKEFLKREKGAKCRTVNSALTAIDSFYEFLGLGKTNVARDYEE